MDPGVGGKVGSGLGPTPNPKNSQQSSVGWTLGWGGVRATRLRWGSWARWGQKGDSYRENNNTVPYRMAPCGINQYMVPYGTLRY